MWRSHRYRSEPVRSLSPLYSVPSGIYLAPTSELEKSGWFCRYSWRSISIIFRPRFWKQKEEIFDNGRSREPRLDLTDCLPACSLLCTSWMAIGPFHSHLDGSSWTSYVFYLVDVLFAIPRFFARDSLILVLYSSQLLHLHFLVLKSFGYSPRVFLLPVGVGVGIEARFATRFFATCMFFTNLSLCEACSKMSD